MSVFPSFSTRINAIYYHCHPLLSCHQPVITLTHIFIDNGPYSDTLLQLVLCPWCSHSHHDHQNILDLLYCLSSPHDQDERSRIFTGFVSRYRIVSYLPLIDPALSCCRPAGSSLHTGTRPHGWIIGPLIPLWHSPTRCRERIADRQQCSRSRPSRANWDNSHLWGGQRGGLDKDVEVTCWFCSLSFQSRTGWDCSSIFLHFHLQIWGF